MMVELDHFSVFGTLASTHSKPFTRCSFFFISQPSGSLQGLRQVFLSRPGDSEGYCGGRPEQSAGSLVNGASENSPRCSGPRPLVSRNSTGKGSWVRIPPPALKNPKLMLP